MHHALRHPSLVPLLASLACTPAESSRTEPDPQPSPAVAVTPAAPPAAVPSEPTQASKPAIPSSEPAPSPTATPVASADPSPLRVVAVREGTIELSGWSAALVPLLDGEPFVLAGGRPSRSVAASHGLPPTPVATMEESSLASFGGRLDQPAGAWLTISTYPERAAEIHHTYHQQGPLWEPVDLRRGPLRAHHSFYVERGGALLAYQRWSADHEQDLYGEWDESPKAGRFRARVEAAMRGVTSGFVQLAGAPVAVPVVPDDVEAYDAATSADGTLYASASPHQYDEPDVLLVWPPGATEAQRVELPGLSDVADISSSVSGEHVLVYGRDSDEAYLAIGKGTELQRVSVEEADRSSKGHQLTGGARASDGTLWIAFGDDVEDGEERPVWRKPVDGVWQPVPLPAFDRAWFPSDPQWGLANGYGTDEGALAKVLRKPELDAAALHATSLRWADDAVWVSLDVGDAYADDALGNPPRTVLLTTSAAAGSAPPVVLPSTLALYLERHNQAHQNDVPGAKSCPHPVLVLGPASLVEERPDAVKALEDHAPTSETAPGIEHAYIGELDGTRVLAGHARARTRAQAKALATALGKAVGLTVTAGCRVPTVERVLE